MLYNQSPFTLVNNLSNIPFGSEVFVISDEKYKELKKNQAAAEVAVLEGRLESYEKAADRLRETIASLNEEHGLLAPTPPPTETPNY